MNFTPAVYVVDAEASARDAVRDLVLLMNLRCETFGDGESFLRALGPNACGCAVLEVCVPGVSGLEIHQRLQQEHPLCSTLFLTRHATVSMAVRALRAGAVHFLEKPLREHELWDAIQEGIARSEARWQRSADRLHRLERLAQLSSRERRILELIAAGLPKSAIATQLNICIRTVEIRRNELMRKLGVENMAELMRFGIVANHSALHDARQAEYGRTGIPLSDAAVLGSRHAVDTPSRPPRDGEGWARPTDRETLSELLTIRRTFEATDGNRVRAGD